jgi:hypothetical protein
MITQEQPPTKALTAKERMMICRTCPKSQLTKILGRKNVLTCGKFLEETEETCGCILSLATKVPTKHCKSKKW